MNAHRKYIAYRWQKQLDRRISIMLFAFYKKVLLSREKLESKKRCKSHKIDVKAILVEYSCSRGRYLKMRTLLA